MRDVEAWLDHERSVFLAALWSDDEASVAVRFPLPTSIPEAEFNPQIFIEAAEAMQ